MHIHNCSALFTWSHSRIWQVEWQYSAGSMHGVIACHTFTDISGHHDWYCEQNCGEGWGLYTRHPGGCPLSRFAESRANEETPLPPTMSFYPAICDEGLWRCASVNDAKCYVVSELRGISELCEHHVMFTVDKEGFQKFMEKSTRSPPTSTDAVYSIQAAAQAARE